jgi:predicted transcriptional regulator
MDQATTDRLRVKHPENTLHQKLRDEVGLCPAQADKALEIFLEHARINYDESRPPGQILRTVVSAVEPAGKPIKHCQTLEVRLTVDHRLDAEIQRRNGTVALRRAKVLRLCWEAYEQGGLLSYEDLAAILGLDQSSIQRMVKALRPVVGLVPTRGAMHDMGRAPSHKEPIGRLLCRGYSYTEITAMTGHTEGSIDRYALDLGRVIALSEQGAAPNDIRIICDLSETAVECYLRLYREHDTDEFRQHIDKLKRRFESGKGVVGPGQLLPRKPAVDPLERLQKRNYPCAVSRLLQQTLDLTGPVADLVADKIAALDAQVFADHKRLLPGQTILLVESADSAPKYSGHTAANRPLVPVVLSPWTPDKIEIWRSDRSPAEKRALIADALARESREQGGTSTIDLLALLLGSSSAVTASALAALRQRQDDPTPIKGITEDAGATLTHKEVICDLRDAGYTPPEISVITCHAPESRDRYLKTDLRVETLIKVLEAIPDDVQAARFLGIPRSVVAQYLRRWRAKRQGDEPAAADNGGSRHAAGAPS